MRPLLFFTGPFGAKVVSIDIAVYTYLSISQTVYNTKSARAHTQREKIILQFFFVFTGRFGAKVASSVLFCQSEYLYLYASLPISRVGASPVVAIGPSGLDRSRYSYIYICIHFSLCDLSLLFTGPFGAKVIDIDIDLHTYVSLSHSTASPFVHRTVRNKGLYL